MSGVEGEGDRPVTSADDAAEDQRETSVKEAETGAGSLRDTSGDNGTTGGSGGDATGGDKLVAAMQEGLKVAVNIFNGKVGAPGAAFGFGSVGQAESASTGPMPEATITSAVEHYVRPDAYEDALDALRSDGLVVLSGAVGLGKRTGALSLLRDVLPAGTPIVSLLPTVDLGKLADRDYKTGYGYVIFDWFGADGGREAEHTWQRLSVGMHEAGAYLAVTVTDRPRHTPESVRYIAWGCPGLSGTLREYLCDAVTEETIEEIVEHLPPQTAMADIVRIAGEVNGGTKPQAAVDKVLDQSKRREITAWFDEVPNRRLILDLTTLAFLVGVDERAFDTGRALLETALDRTMPVPEPETASGEPDDKEVPVPVAETAMLQDRQRLRENPLIRLASEVIDGVPRRGLVFREGGQRRYVLEELADRFGVGYWDAVRAWLSEVVEDQSLQLPVAEGLALLAYSAFEEIEDSYLDPWAAGGQGWPQRYTAVYTLWFMCFDEALAPIALRTVVRWAGHGSTGCRHTAVIAFSGELGVRYPSEAANRLWQLVAQHNKLSEAAAVGFGNLFATLIARDVKAELVINLLSTRLRRTSPYGKTRLRYRWTLLTAFAVVDTRNPVSGRPAISEYLVGNADRIAVVGRIWAALLRHRPIRHSALLALLKALRALESLSEDAERDAKALGDALGDALPEDEHAALTTDFTKLARSSAEGRTRSDALAQIMLSALDRAHRRSPGGVS